MKKILMIVALVGCLFTACQNKSGNVTISTSEPRIANIINFVRKTEPRPVNISDEDLYQTVVEQVKLLKKHQLPGTFLLQYDALIDSKYQILLREEMPENCEIGGWWEITQPQVEDAGITWRGAYSWDWHANVGFSTGYTPEEREKLVDVFMAKFKSIFGKYPQSIGSWFVDAHSLQYMEEKYHIVASCNCKDQVGTDGYTMWGGYWNQGYYPSKKNAYLPAQTEEGQIQVPIFRMLGSDPIHQYYSGVGGNMQAVETLEPVNEAGGGNDRWINWFYDIVLNQPTLGFQYMQIGQENSFTWPRMKRGLELQIAKLDSLSTLGEVRVETLAATGQWFKDNYNLTPATSVVALKDLRDSHCQSVWYNSRFYRANLYWQNGIFLLRDIHLFDENFESDYLTKAGTSTQCDYRALPFIDGFSWSTAKQYAGLHLMKKNVNGDIVEMRTSNVIVSNEGEQQMKVQFIAGEKTTCTFLLSEEILTVIMTGIDTDSWWLEFATASEIELPFVDISDAMISGVFKGFPYQVECANGHFEAVSMMASKGISYRIYPQENNITLDLTAIKR